MVDELTGTLAGWAGQDRTATAVAETISSLSEAAKRIARDLAVAPLHAGASEVFATNASGDAQKRMDLLAHEAVMEVMRRAPVAVVASEECDAPVALNRLAPLVVAVDPLDGSGNLSINGPSGLIFSIRLNSAEPDEVFLGPGCEQVAAGFFLFGPATIFVVTVGAGTDVYVLDAGGAAFVRTAASVVVPAGTPAYSVNSSNARHWSPAFRSYIRDLEAGADGLRGQDFNMRWYGALVLEAFRILLHGGIYLYPADRRPRYRNGRIRLVYEAHPIAMIMEQSGATATDGSRAIMSKRPESLHERTPLVFGSADKVARVTRCLDDLSYSAETAPLFASRGLFRD